MAAEKPNPSDYLLYPQKRTGRSERWNREVEGVIWEDRSKPLSATAITEFLRSGGNLKLAQQLARHASIQTTADIYGHLDDVDLERALTPMDSLS